MKIENPTDKTECRLKKLIPPKPSFYVPSKVYNYFTEKEVKFIKKEAYNKFNNHPPNININSSLRNRNNTNITNNDRAIVINTTNNSFKNFHLLLRNRINMYDYKRNFINDSPFAKTKSMKRINNHMSESNDDNKENSENIYNIIYNNNSIIKNERTIIVNKANKMIKENKNNNNNKKLNLKTKTKRRTFSSILNAAAKNLNNNDKKNNRNKNNKIGNSNNKFLLNNLFYKHKKGNSTMRNFKDNKNFSLKSLSIDKINSSRSFSNSVGKKYINRNLSKSNAINKSELNNNENTKNRSKNTNHFYSSLKQILPYKGKSNVKNIERYRNEKFISKENQLSKSFTTNNYIKKFYLTQIGKFRYEPKNNKVKRTKDYTEKNRKIQHNFKCLKLNNVFLKSCNNNCFKSRKRHKINSISNLSDLDYQILNRSRDSVISQKNFFIIEEPKVKVIKKIIKIDSCTIPGYTINGMKQKNQDSFFLKKNFLSVNEQFLIGICDGHGLFGDLVSQYISETLPSYIKNTSKEELTRAFIDTNESLINKTKIDCSLSGATCTTLIITLDKIICANIGNTRAILAKFENGCYNSVNLSRDHKPTESDEIKRIISEGGLIKQLYDKKRKEYIGPERIWLRNSDIPGLSMSRTFGDYIAHTVGVINIPEIKIVDFTGGEKFIVVASDSIWQFIDSDECIEIIKDYYEKDMNAIGALNSLVSEAIKRWKKQENKIEDITAVVIFFE
jgi:serine/threonine protein phosphatase PrpC